MSEIIAGPLLLRAISRRNNSESILILSEDLYLKSSSLAFTPTTSWNTLNIEATSLSSVLTVAVTNLKFPSESSLTSSKPTSDPVAEFPRITSQFVASVMPSGLISKTNFKNSTPVAPNTIIALPPDNSVTENQNNLDAIHDLTITSSQSPWSMTGVIVGLVAITSLMALTIYLMGKKKRRSGLIKSFLTSHQSSSNLNRPFESFTSAGQKNNPWGNSSSRIHNFIRGLKFKLRGNSSNSFEFRDSSQEKIHLDRGNSQFFDEIFDYNGRNESSVAHCLTGSPRRNATRWSARHMNKIDIPRISRTKLTDPSEIENVVEKVSKLESQCDLGQLQSYRHIRPDQVFLEKRVSDVENKGRVSTGDKTAIISKFHEGEPDVDQRASQIRVSQTIIQYSSEILSSKSPVSPQDPSLASSYNGNRESVYSRASCYATERINKKKSDQFDLDSPDLWQSRTCQIL